MSEIAFKKFGPQKYLSFPVQLNIGWVNSRRKVAFLQYQADTKFLQQADTKLVHNTESIQYQGVLKKDEEDGRKVLNCQNLQQPASEVAPIKIQLKSNFIWPDKELSFSLWFSLKDDLFSKPNDPKVRRRPSKLNFSLEQNEYISEELIHLCSFGALNAVFEVWLGTSSGLLQFRLNVFLRESTLGMLVKITTQKISFSYLRQKEKSITLQSCKKKKKNNCYSLL